MKTTLHRSLYVQVLIAIGNVIGNGVATLVVAKWTGELDVTTLKRELGGPPDIGKEPQLAAGL